MVAPNMLVSGIIHPVYSGRAEFAIFTVSDKLYIDWQIPPGGSADRVALEVKDRATFGTRKLDERNRQNFARSCPEQGQYAGRRIKIVPGGVRRRLFTED
jgi:hypothetical protein